MSMKFIGAAIVLGLSLVACNTNAGVFPVGIPSVILSVKDSQFGPVTEDVNGTTVTSFKVSGTLEARTQKGSTAGTVVVFKAGNTELLPGPFVEACPVTSANECGPFSSNYSLTFASDPGPLKITSIVVQALNGTPYEVKLAAPVVLR
jgi:hypothetical protein